VRDRVARDGISEAEIQEKNPDCVPEFRIRMQQNPFLREKIQKNWQKKGSSACILYQQHFFYASFHFVVHAIRTLKIIRRRSLNGSFHEKSCCEEAGPQACSPYRSRDYCRHL
jgi:hypothetical protein